MASLYVPQLTRWREVVGGVERERVQHEGSVLNVSRADCVVAGEGDADQRERVEIAGKLFPLVDETEVALRGGGVVRCVEYKSPPRRADHGVLVAAPASASSTSLLLTVTDWKDVEEVLVPGGALRVAGFGGCFTDYETGTVQHVLDVHGEQEAFMLLVSVREDLGRIVSIKRLN